jgi:CheY-like chemotaxis protein
MDFFTELETGRFSFAFVSAGLTEGAESLIRRLKIPTNLVLLGELGESSSVLNIPVILMPIYAVPAANILNGVRTRQTTRNAAVRFTAPQARALIVDDILTNLKVAQGLLLPYLMQVDICDNGKGAIALIRANRYDLIFMDHMMPVMDGIETVKQIRELEGEYFKKVPIIALTANAIVGMREMFLDNAFNDYLAKPIELSKLNEILEKWIPQKKRLKQDLTENRQKPAPPVIDHVSVVRLKKALEAGKTGIIDLALNELLMMPFEEEQKKILSDIWDQVLAEDFKNAVVLTDRLVNGGTNE